VYLGFLLENHESKSDYNTMNAWELEFLQIMTARPRFRKDNSTYGYRSERRPSLVVVVTLAEFGSSELELEVLKSDVFLISRTLSTPVISTSTLQFASHFDKRMI